MISGNIFKLMFITSLLFSIIILGCGSGGGGGSNLSGGGSIKSGGGSNLSGGGSMKSASIQVSPSAYDFGPVTPGNSPAPLYVEIKNNGTGSLNVSNISLQDTTNFTLNLNGGSNPCGSASKTVIAGDRCTAEVRFQPQSTDSFSTNLTITSNDSANSELYCPLSGSREDISTLNVRINQVGITCPSGIVTAYVTVMDQGGYPVTGLTIDDFSITETAGYAGPPASSSYVENNATLSVALAMDYSRSVILDPDMVSDMKEGAVSFVNHLGAEDEAEFITFTSKVNIIQSFTSDHNLLLAAIDTPFDTNAAGTALYDAGKIAIDTTESRSKDRKAVVIMTDGEDNSSSIGVDDLINYSLSKNVPLFPVGLGDLTDDVDLKKLADSTGGQYYTASNSDNLRNVYLQLADVLLSFQYILTYNSGLADGTTADLTIGATLPLTTIAGSNTRSITSCP
jgi:Ca-activated chloride channel family protein